MTIGLICAIPQEIEHLRDAMRSARRNDVAGVQFETGALDGHDVVLAGAGMGKVNAALAATLLADRFGCRAIVFSGVAGGLDPMLSIGDVVVADRIIQHDAGLIEDERLRTYQAGHVPFINPTDQLGYAVATDLLVRVSERLDGIALPALSPDAGGPGRAPLVTYGTVLSGDQFLHCENTRGRLRREFAGRAIEMEGGALAQVCESFAIPWLVIRALSDLAGRDSRFDFDAFAGEVAASSAMILRRLLPVL